MEVDELDVVVGGLVVDVVVVVGGDVVDVVVVGAVVVVSTGRSGSRVGAAGVSGALEGITDRAIRMATPSAAKPPTMLPILTQRV